MKSTTTTRTACTPISTLRRALIAAGIAATLLPGMTFAQAYPVGSSRVDLQACKLEYSIVSPK